MYVVNENTFLYSVMVSLKIPTKREIIQYLKRNGLRYKEEEIDSLMPKIRERKTMLHDPGIALIVFYRWDRNAFDYGVLVHELFHAVDMNLRSKGIVLSDDSDETYAYHMGYFSREFLHSIWTEKK